MKGPEVHLEDDGIMRVEYPLHANVHLSDVQNEYKQRIAITEKQCPILVKLHGLIGLNDEAKKFLCGPEHSKITSAAAILVDPKAGYYEHSKVLIDLFKNVNKPPFDLKVFIKEGDAIIWLQQYLEK